MQRLRETASESDCLRLNPAAERLRYADHYWRTTSLTGQLCLHQARHAYASFMIAAGVNPKALSSFMGHSSITVTFDLYGHLMPGNEAEGGVLLDAYLAKTKRKPSILTADTGKTHRP